MSSAETTEKQTPGIGNHWASIGITQQDDIKALLVKAMAEGDLIGEGNGFKLLQYRLKPHMAVIAVTTAAGEAATIYPAVQHAIAMNLRLEAIRPDKGGYPEAELICRHPLGAEIVFWDTHYATNSHRYKVGESYDFMIGGIGYKVEDDSDAPPVEISNPEQVRRMRALQGQDPELPGPITVSMKGMGSFVPCNPDDPEWKYPEYAVRGPVALMHLPGGDAGYGMFAVVVSGADDGNSLAISITCHANHILSVPKEEFGEVFSLVWLQGYLAG